MTSNTQLNQQTIVPDGDNNCISEVVVFSNQAFIKRQLTTKLVSGFNQILVELNAYYVDQDSIQASVFAEGEILSVQYRQIPVTEAVQNNVRELDERKKQLEQQKKTLGRQKESLDKQNMFLDSTISYAQVQLPREVKTQFPTPENLQAMLEFLQHNFDQLNHQQTDLEQQLQDLEEQLQLVQRQLKQLKKPAQANKQYIEVLFSSEQQQTVQADVSYVVTQASWKPVYKVDADAELEHIIMTSFAHIEQNTGEHWHNVSLTVSNAVPLKGGRLPVQNSWRLHLSSTQHTKAADFMVRSAATAMPVGLDELGEEAGSVLDDLSLDEAPIAAASYAQSEQQELPLAIEFALPQPVSIDSAGDNNLLPIATDSIKGHFFHLCMPQQDVLVYLVCEAMLENTLLPGKLNIYFAGRFVASTWLAEKQAGEELLINLGAERDVKVNRQKISDKLSDSFFGVVDRLSAAREFSYQTDIENLKNKTIKLRLIDAVPVSSSDRIQIKEIKCNPPADSKDWQEKEGVMRWELELNAKQSKKITTSFFVKYPKDDPPYEI